MKAVIAANYGRLDQVAVQEADAPQVKTGEVLVEILAASVNPLDIKIVSGAMQGYFPLQLPFIVGTDFAGVVAEGAGQIEKGQRVFGRLEPLPVDGNKFGRTGAFAQFANVPVASLTGVPDALSTETAAALPTAAGTAWQAIYEAGKIEQGQTVLIHGGAGGVGGFAVQFAHRVGAHVIATASGANLDYVQKLGASTVIDYRNQDFASIVQGVDLIVDTVGGDTLERSFGVLRQGGLLLSTVQPPDERKATSFGVTASFVFHTTSSQRLRQIAQHVVEGYVHVEIANVFSLQDSVAALQQVATGRTKGKVLVSIA